MSRVQIVRGDARHLPLTDNTVDLICTSPPYFALRSYTDAGEHFANQIGSEATPAEWLAALLEVTRECVRVLKPSGSLFVNLGDKYAGVGGSNDHGWAIESDSTRERRAKVRVPLHQGRNAGGVRSKSLFGLPWRYALACIDQLGLILRAEIVWNKPNGLPESVTDRVRRSHESFFHFTLQPRYYSAVDEIREPQQTVFRAPQNGTAHHARAMADGQGHHRYDVRDTNPLGKLPGSVWTIPSEPLTVPPELGVDHFAAFPLEWPRRIIRGWCPAAVCSGCGEGRRPVTSPSPDYQRKLDASKQHRNGAQQGWGAHGGSQGGFMWHVGQKSGETSERVIAGYVCACTPHTDHPGTGERDMGGQIKWSPDGQTPRQRQVGGHLGNAPRVGPQREYHFDGWTPPPATPGVVLDPFGGTGTTALAALALGRDAIHIDLSADYNRIAAWRTTDRDQLAKAMQVTRDDRAREADLFDMEPLFEGLG